MLLLKLFKTSIICTFRITIQHGALVCDESKLRGEITIGANSIIHPSAVIYAESGPIIIGDHCIIEEKAKIIHRQLHSFIFYISLTMSLNINNF